VKLEWFEFFFAQGHRVGHLEIEQRQLLAHAQLIQFAVGREDDAAEVGMGGARRFDLDPVRKESAGKRRERIEVGGGFLKKTAQAFRSALEEGIGFVFVAIRYE